jgi:hypothetical protein
VSGDLRDFGMAAPKDWPASHRATGAADLGRDELHALGLRVMRELAEGAVSDEIRLQAAISLVEYAVKVGWHDERVAQEAAKVDGEPWRWRR